MTLSPQESPQLSEPVRRKKRRLRFSFSLRTMFVVVLLLAIPFGYLAWQIQIVRERKAILAELGQIAGDSVTFRYLPVGSSESYLYDFQEPTDVSYTEISRVRQLLGDKPCFGLIIPQALSSQLVVRIENAFPESVIRVFGLQYGVEGIQFRDSLYKPESERRKNKGTLFKTGKFE